MIKTKEFGNAGIINGYEICIASANEPDCSLAMHYGEKGENYIEISIYDNNSILFEKVKIE